MSQDVLLHGFGFTGFRSFYGEWPQRIGPLSKVHLVAGTNNAGKSNVLTVAQRLLPTAVRGGSAEVETVDRPKDVDPDEARLSIEIAYPWSDAARQRIRDALEARRPGLGSDMVAALDRLADPDDVLWLQLEPSHHEPAGPGRFVASERQAQSLGADTTVFEMVAGVLESNAFSLRSAGGVVAALNYVRMQLTEVTPVPPVATVPAFRQIGPGGDGAIDDGHGGPGLIKRLQELQAPSGFEAAEEERRFDALTRFVATLFDDQRAEIRAANDGSTIYVRQNGRRLPLENYGTGVHEVIIIAAAATVLSKSLVCIEEPEIHLHPTLQRKLLTYLSEETDNQYLIATHSAHLLDTARASISAVSMVDGRSRVAPAITPREVADLGAELGLRASDLVQANAIVWVEGPSDRTYLRHWLSLVAPDLIEGHHFSIMFYGGALLTELSPQDPSVTEFISLPRINRNFSILIDSDRPAEGAPLNGTKTRVAEAFAEEAVRGVVWVTAGYTIENYVPPELLAEAVEAVHPNATYAWSGEQFENPLAKARFTDRASAADKSAIAREVVERWTADIVWPFDLDERVRLVAASLREVNDLPPAP